MKQALLIASALAGALLVAPTAWSQAPATGPLASELQARKVVKTADGREELTSAEAAKPGDILEYTATFRNTGKTTLTMIEATLPIPTNVEFVPGSAKPANPKATDDGKRFADLPLKRVVKRNGVDVEEIVPVREYRMLRWAPIDLGGEKSASYVARVRVLDDVPVTPGSPGVRK
ncbi:hypothetical protein DSM104443_01802 [Usitatibacter rugosus]|uniref:Repeat protein (TIGR01451 family) n=1 Tax=Usitatibacter rugosus TaxID=2732067 RepID=A0A6M4GWK2_9PROT|nr:DUF11 domain-containing protein [Usitatibacter rugosus]QJR10733.1 hypothetical protein DSM104443_01802 [Usitatibacter rugosus]